MNLLKLQEQYNLQKQEDQFIGNVEKYISETAVEMLDKKIDDMIYNCIEKYILCSQMPEYHPLTNQMNSSVVQNNNQKGQNTIISNLLLCTQQIIQKQEQQIKQLKDNFLKQKAIIEQAHKQNLKKQFEQQNRQKQKIQTENTKLKQTISRLQTELNIQKLTKNQQLLNNQKKINDLNKKIHQLKQQNQKIQYEQLKEKSMLQAKEIVIKQLYETIKQQEKNMEITNIELQAFKISYWSLQQSEINYKRIEAIKEQRQKQQRLILLLNQLSKTIDNYPIDHLIKDQHQIKNQNEVGKNTISIEFEISTIKQAYAQYEEEVTKNIEKLIRIIHDKTDLSQHLQMQLETTNNALQQTEQQLLEMNNKYNQLQKINEQLIDEIDILKQQLQKAKDKNMIYLEQLTEIKDKVIGFKDNNLNLQNRKDQLSKKLQKTKINLEEMTKQNLSLKIQIQSLKDSLQTVRKIQKSEDSEEQQEKTIIDQMIQKSYAIRLENRQLKNIHESTHKQLQQLESFNEKLIRDKESIQAQLTIMRENFQNKQIQYQRLSIHMNEHSLKNQQTIASLRKELDKQILHSTQLQQKINTLQEQLNILKQAKLHQNDATNTFTTFRNQQTRTQLIIDGNFRKEVGKTAKNIRKNKSISISSINDENKQLNSEASISLNRTYKFNQQNSDKYIKYIANLNEIINYLINYAKGYTRNGYRKNSWIGQAGPLQKQKALQQKNIRMKFQNFEKIRQLCSKQAKCKELIKTFEKIMDYYFRNVELEASSIDLTL